MATSYLSSFLCLVGYADQPTAAEEPKKKGPKLVLHYWDYNFWRAEMLRIAMTLGKVEFEEKFITNTEEWRKSGVSPLGQAPVLVVDGKSLTQTGAMGRYVGKLSGQYPKDAWQAARVDMVIDSMTDMSNMIYGKQYRGLDQKERSAIRRNMLEDPAKLPKYFKMLTRELKNNGSNGFIAGDSMTIADIALWRMLMWFQEGVLDGMATNCLDQYTELLTYWKGLDKHPGIRAYWDARYKKAEQKD